MNNFIDKALFIKMLNNFSENIKKEASNLSEIDAKFGDGDHGITMTKVAGVVEKVTEEKKDETIKEILNAISSGCSSLSGGAAGPLWGVFFEGLKNGVTKEPVNAKVLKNMITSSLEEMRTVSSAKKGDKTMMDALIEAVEAVDKLDTENIKDILQETKNASQKGAKDTEKYAAKFGRAKNYKEQSIGTPDCGAISMSIFFASLFEVYN